jgi:hypothetical protein
MNRPLAACLLILLAAAASVAADIAVKFPAKGDYQVWFEDDEGRPLGRRATVEDLASTTVTVPDGGAITIAAIDKKASVLAAKPFEGKAVDFAKEDFRYAERVKVTVEHGGLPVANGLVLLKDSEQEHRATLSPDVKGEVSFERVALGEVVTWVEYRVKGEERTSDEIHKTLRAGDESAVISFSIADDVAVVGEEEAGAAPERRAARPGALSVGSLITILLAAALGAAALYAILRLVQSRREWVAQKMEKLGVQLPGEPADDAAATHTTGFGKEPEKQEPLVPEGICPFCGQVKGPDGSCACTPGRAAAPPGPVSPRLLGMVGPYTGRPFDVATDQITVGREAGNVICLDQDSSVSRRHAKLTRQGGALTVEDLGSTNGTFVNGRKVEASTTLSPGDSVQFGESHFKYEA